MRNRSAGTRQRSGGRNELRITVVTEAAGGTASRPGFSNPFQKPAEAPSPPRKAQF